MMEKKGNSQNLAEMLRSHKEEIVAAWANKVKDIPNTHYQQFPLGEVTNWTSKGLETIVETLETNSDQAIEKYTSDIAFARLQAGFPIFEVTQGILLAKEVILPIVQSSYPDSSNEAIEAITQLDSCLRLLIDRFERMYSDGMHRRFLEETEKRLAESESLQRTTTALLQNLIIDEILEIVCSEARKLTGAAGSAVLLVEEKGWLRVSISTGKPVPVVERLPIEDSIAGRAMQDGIPILINETVNQVQAYHRNKEPQALLVVPLLVEDMSIGVIDVVNKQEGFTDEDIGIMSLFAGQAAIAIENARLRLQSEKLAIMEERQRLARELHDSVTQSLYSVTLYADATRLALLSDNEVEAIENLNELRNMAREAMLDMRLLIFELHPPILEKEGLVAAIKTRLESVEARSGIETEFIVKGDRRLPLSIESEIYRISQEALNNVVRHAKAQYIKINLLITKRRFRMEIFDDGKGFDPILAKQSSGMGLRGINERVQKIHGDLSIDSSSGNGTTIAVEVEF